MIHSEPRIRSPFVDPHADLILTRLSSPRRALFLDRDGVINVDHGYVCSPERTEFIESTWHLISTALAEGFLPVVVTNQAGIARALYTEADFLDYTSWMHQQLDTVGCPLIATYYCPHHPLQGNTSLTTPCTCRKPEPGMFLSARHDLEIDLSASRMIGDKKTDIEAALSAGIKAENCTLVTGRFERMQGLLP